MWSRNIRHPVFRWSTRACASNVAAWPASLFFLSAMQQQEITNWHNSHVIHLSQTLIFVNISRLTLVSPEMLITGWGHLFLVDLNMSSFVESVQIHLLVYEMYRKVPFQDLCYFEFIPLMLVTSLSHTRFSITSMYTALHTRQSYLCASLPASS